MFFDSVPSAPKSSVSLLPKCGICGLSTGCKSPKMPVTGKGRKGILIVAEAPGKDEDDKGEQLVGAAGQKLRKALRKFDIDLDLDCWKTNSIICRPPDNRTPTSNEIDYCRPNLLRAIKELNPRIIIPLGGAAVRSVIGPLWRSDPGSVSTWVGWKIPCQRYNCWIAPNFHPSYVVRSEKEREGPVIELWFERYLQAAVELKDRPWVEVPDFKKEVRVEMNPEAAARWIRAAIAEGGVYAFDYETNRLKPDHPKAEIVCCSIYWNLADQVISYPWLGDAITATREFIASPVPKMGWNKKFEERWTRRVLGVPVNNWVWDGMLSAHHLDCRAGITSAKFQGFVRLGQEDWSQGIHEFLSSTNSEGFNRIRECDLRKLLVYCGIDSLVEAKVGRMQKKEMMCR